MTGDFIFGVVLGALAGIVITMVTAAIFERLHRSHKVKITTEHPYDGENY